MWESNREAGYGQGFAKGAEGTQCSMLVMLGFLLITKFPASKNSVLRLTSFCSSTQGTRLLSRSHHYVCMCIHTQNNGEK